METNSGSGFLKFLSFIFAILSVVDSIVHLVKSSNAINDSNNENTTNIYIIILMVIRLFISVDYIVLTIIARRFGLNDFIVILNAFVYALTLALVMILSCFVIQFQHSSISLICHIIATYLAFAVCFKLLVHKYIGEYENIDEKPTKKSGIATVLNIFDKNILAFSTLITVVIAVVIGVILREYDPYWSNRSVKYVGFIGEIFLRMLKCLILPLIFSSLVYAMASIDTKLSGKIGFRTVVYYIGTTVLAIILGIILVMTIRPGYSTVAIEEESQIGQSRKLTTIDTILDLIRY